MLSSPVPDLLLFCPWPLIGDVSMSVFPVRDTSSQRYSDCVVVLGFLLGRTESRSFSAKIAQRLARNYRSKRNMKISLWLPLVMKLPEFKDSMPSVIILLVSRKGTNCGVGESNTFPYFRSGLGACANNMTLTRSCTCTCMIALHLFYLQLSGYS